MARRWQFWAIFIISALALVHFRMEYRAVTSTYPNSWSEDVRADCAVVLTGGAGRVKEGVDLLYRGAVKKLIISGVHPRATWRDIWPQLPFYGNLHEEDIVLERRSTTTYGNAIQSLPLVEALHCHSVALVTSTLHMRRAYQTFRGVFPPDFPVLSYAILAGRREAELAEASMETIKSVFYSLWAY